ncbi:hypothetical protein, partial [Pseudomonas avellanae]|uniref:hypothetical protein n=1 Tax=Pseudomonas avellanae TaxID=46257 RepID=UPI001F40A0E8
MKDIPGQNVQPQKKTAPEVLLMPGATCPQHENPPGNLPNPATTRPRGIGYTYALFQCRTQNDSSADLPYGLVSPDGHRAQYPADIPGRRQKLSATPDQSGTVNLCHIMNSALKNA